VDAGFGKPAKLIEIPKRIKERGSPGIAATRRVGGLGRDAAAAGTRPPAGAFQGAMKEGM